MESLESQAGAVGTRPPHCALSPLVKFVAGRVGSGLPRSVDPADLVGYGVFGLIDAIEKFDLSRGQIRDICSTANPRRDYDGLRELDWVPRTVRTRGRRIEQALTELERELGRSPSEDELATHLEISIDELATWLSEIAATTVGTLDRAISMGFEPEADARWVTYPGRGCRSRRVVPLFDR